MSDNPQKPQSVGTTRLRMSDIEEGRAYVGAVELGVLVRLLEITPERVWPVAFVDSIHRKVSVGARPGEKVEVVVRLVTDS